jgi:excisionase family DNA binding protein
VKPLIDIGTSGRAAAGSNEYATADDSQKLAKDGNGLALLISVKETTSILGIGRTQVFELIMQGSITSVKIGRRRLVVRRDLEDFVSHLSASQSSQVTGD